MYHACKLLENLQRCAIPFVTHIDIYFLVFNKIPGRKILTRIT